MHLDELIERLQEAREQIPEDVNPVVRLATQPTYPLAFSVRGVALQSEIDDTGDLTESEDVPEEIVWIVEGGSPYDGSPYAPRDAWDAAS